MPQYTLQSFKLLLEREPIGVDNKVREQARQDYEDLKSRQAKPEEIESKMINYGKQVWPYWQAELEFLKKYGREKKEELFVSGLSEQLKDKWQQFEIKGGSLHDYRQGNKYEQAFSAEENHLIEESLTEAEKAVRDYIHNLAPNQKKEEYKNLVNQYQSQEQEIIKKLEELKQLKERGEKWGKEIEKEVYFFEKGLAELEVSPTVAKVQEKIDWYQGQIEAGNK